MTTFYYFIRKMKHKSSNCDTKVSLMATGILKFIKRAFAFTFKDLLSVIQSVSTK